MQDSGLATLLLKQGWLGRCIVRVAKIAQTNTNQAKALLRIKAHPIAQGRGDVGQLLTGRRRRVRHMQKADERASHISPNPTTDLANLTAHPKLLDVSRNAAYDAFV